MRIKIRARDKNLPQGRWMEVGIQDKKKLYCWSCQIQWAERVESQWGTGFQGHPTECCRPPWAWIFHSQSLWEKNTSLSYSPTEILKQGYFIKDLIILISHSTSSLFQPIIEKKTWVMKLPAQIHRQESSPRVSHRRQGHRGQGILRSHATDRSPMCTTAQLKFIIKQRHGVVGGKPFPTKPQCC